MNHELYITDLSKVDRTFQPRTSYGDGWRIEAEFYPKKSKKPSMRLSLRVRLDGECGTMVVLGINPSTAGSNSCDSSGPMSDMTITKVSRVVSTLGYTELLMLNLYDKISPYQDVLKGEKPTIGEHKDLLNCADAVLVAWGVEAKKKYPEAVDIAEKMLWKLHEKGVPVYCIARTKDGELKQGLHPRVWCYSEDFRILPYKF